MTDPEMPPPAPTQTPAPPSSGWQAAPPPPTVPGAAGYVYADVPNRVIGLIIDGIIVAIITAVVNVVAYGIVGQPVSINIDAVNATNLNGLVSINYFATLVGVIISLIIGSAYYIYLWTTRRATFGQSLLGMQVGNFPDGKTLTLEQGVRRWAALFAPFSVSQVAWAIPTLGAIVGLLTFIYAIYLLYTTAQSPTKQGFHDKFANSVVVKAARTAG
ncbi:MAG: RDD family protein [Chloroflexota bacterium]